MAQPTEVQFEHERDQAYRRVLASDALRPYADTLVSSLLRDEEGWEWLATAPETEVLKWAVEHQGIDADAEMDIVADLGPEKDEDWQ
jgi:hypothetical protein